MSLFMITAPEMKVFRPPEPLENIGVVRFTTMEKPVIVGIGLSGAPYLLDLEAGIWKLIVPSDAKPGDAFIFEPDPRYWGV